MSVATNRTDFAKLLWLPACSTMLLFGVERKPPPFCQSAGLHSRNVDRKTPMRILTPTATVSKSTNY